MQSYNINFSKYDTGKRYVITMPVNLKSLSDPLTLTREKSEEVTEEIQLRQNTKKKSEAVEIEDENYKKLKEVEREPLLITDRDQRSFTGRLQDMNVAEDVNANDNYFVLINKGSSFKLVPIKNRYRFSQKVNYETLTLDEAEQRMSKKKEDKWLMHNRRKDEKFIAKDENDDKDIDYDEKFDDDEQEDIFIFESEEKELSVAGTELKNLMRNYEDKTSDEDENDEIKPNDKKETSMTSKLDEKYGSPLKRKAEKKDGMRKRHHKSSEKTDYDFLRSCIVKVPIKLCEFISEIKKTFEIDDDYKCVIRRFLNDQCFTKKTGKKCSKSVEKYIYLKK